MDLKKLAPLAALAILAVCGCLGGGGLPDNAPAYVDDVYAAKAGTDGISIYFILADETGQQTTAAGYVGIRVSDKSGTLFDAGKNVTASEFQKATLGQGAFKHDAIILNVGRLTLRREPSGTVTTEITFTPRGADPLKGDTTTYF